MGTDGFPATTKIPRIPKESARNTQFERNTFHKRGASDYVSSTWLPDVVARYSIKYGGLQAQLNMVVHKRAPRRFWFVGAAVEKVPAGASRCIES